MFIVLCTTSERDLKGGSGVEVSLRVVKMDKQVLGWDGIF